MKILFVCVANVGRSQMAEAFCNKLSRHEATSAGSQVGEKMGQVLSDRAREAEASSTPGDMLKIMFQEEDLDLYGNVRTQLIPSLVDAADLVVVMCQSDPYPEYLARNPKVTFWNIQDLYGASYNAVRSLKDEVKRHVTALVAEMGPDSPGREPVEPAGQ
ncbi:MAG: hypothetical protein IIB31_07360 [Chloroflexi bacterium]|nr:hypothetical protein [Chloroflexota bacterium]